MYCRYCKKDTLEKTPPKYRVNKCRSCHNLQSKLNQSKSEVKKRRKVWYQKWYQTNGRQRAADYLEIIAEWGRDNPEKLSAHRRVAYALSKGVLTKPDRCSECGREVRLSGHHEDYTRPLSVVWLCSSCHKLRHTT